VPVLGRPGAVLVDGEIAGAGSRKSGNKFTVRRGTLVESPAGQRAAITEQAEPWRRYATRNSRRRYD